MLKAVQLSLVAAKAADEAELASETENTDCSEANEFARSVSEEKLYEVLVNVVDGLGVTDGDDVLAVVLLLVELVVVETNLDVELVEELIVKLVEFISGSVNVKWLSQAERVDSQSEAAILLGSRQASDEVEFVVVVDVIVDTDVCVGVDGSVGTVGTPGSIGSTGGGMGAPGGNTTTGIGTYGTLVVQMG